MNDVIPPLPDLEIDDLSHRLTDQETVDRALKAMYERRPDLFKKMAERDKSGKGDSNDEFTQEFFWFLREELKIANSLVAPRIFWEARRRARLMYGLPIYDRTKVSRLR